MIYKSSLSPNKEKSWFLFGPPPDSMLKGKLAVLHAVSINISYRITLELIYKRKGNCPGKRGDTRGSLLNQGR